MPAIFEVLWNSIVSTTPFLILAGFFGYLFRETFREFLTRKVTQKFEISFARLQAQLEAEARANGDLRLHLLSGDAERRGRLFERKAAALERLWKSTTILSTAKLQVKLLDTVNYPEAVKLSYSDNSSREFFVALGKGLDVDSFLTQLKECDPQAQRPYVSELVWALYSAYSGIVLDYVLKQKNLEVGPPPEILNESDDHLKRLVLAALPHQEAIFEKYPKVTYSIFLEILEEALLAEVKKSLAGEEETSAETQRAREILDIVHNREADA